jgi:hypothetical protein
VDVTQLAALLKALTGSTGTSERLFAEDPLAKAQVMGQLTGQNQMVAPFHGQGIRYLYGGGSPFPVDPGLVNAYRRMGRLGTTVNVLDALANSALLKRRQQANQDQLSQLVALIAPEVARVLGGGGGQGGGTTP